jgi:hypothetical protein
VTYANFGDYKAYQPIRVGRSWLPAEFAYLNDFPYTTPRVYRFRPTRAIGELGLGGTSRCSSMVNCWHESVAELLSALPSFQRMSAADKAAALSSLQRDVAVEIDRSLGSGMRIDVVHQNVVRNLTASPFWHGRFTPDEFSQITQAVNALMTAANADATNQVVPAESIVTKAGGMVLSPAKAIIALSHGDLKGAWMLVSGPVVVLIPGGEKLANGVADMTVAIARGDIKGAGKATWETLKVASPIIQRGLSMLPPLGPQVAAAMALGMTLAQGGRIDDALIAAARAEVPEGPLRGAFDAGVALSQGQPLDEAVINAATRNLKPEEAAALKLGIGLGQGKNVQNLLRSDGARLLMEAVGPTASPLVAQAGAPISKAIAETGTLPPAILEQVRSRLPSKVPYAPLSKLPGVSGFGGGSSDVVSSASDHDLRYWFDAGYRAGSFTASPPPVLGIKQEFMPKPTTKPWKPGDYVAPDVRGIDGFGYDASTFSLYPAADAVRLQTAAWLASQQAAEFAKTPEGQVATMAVAKFGVNSPEADAVKLGIAAGRATKSRNLVLTQITAHQIPVTSKQHAFQIANTTLAIAPKPPPPAKPGAPPAKKAAAGAPWSTKKKALVGGALFLGIGAAIYISMR